MSRAAIVLAAGPRSIFSEGERTAFGAGVAPKKCDKEIKGARDEQSRHYPRRGAPRSIFSEGERTAFGAGVAPKKCEKEIKGARDE